jgi:hypothetical protein
MGHRALPISSPVARPLRVVTAAAVASVPLCCIVPAGFAAMGMVSSTVARCLGVAIPFFFLLSIALFFRAHYLLWVEGHGSHSARALTCLMTIAAIALWAWRLWLR